MYGPPLNHRHRGGGRNLGLVLLMMQVMNIGLEHIPPVTLGVLGTCVAVFLRDVLPVMRGLRMIGNSAVCFSYAHIFNIGAAKAVGFHPLFRVFTAPFFHGDDMHLYYNMASWLMKARWFERSKGSAFMLLWLFLSVLGTSACYVLICAAVDLTGAGDALGIEDWTRTRSCAIGLSGVLFCLKTVLHSEDESRHSVFFGAFTTQAKYAVWFELLLIQMFAGHHVSFLGHLAGILCGMVFNYVHLNTILLAPAQTLQSLFQVPNHHQQQSAPGEEGNVPRGQRFRQSSYTTGTAGTAGRGEGVARENQGTRPSNTSTTSALSEEERQREAARQRWQERYRGMDIGM